MRRFFIGVLIFLIIVAILHLGLFAIINIKGKDILANKIEDSLGIKPEIGELSLYFPFILEIKDFELGSLSFQKANVSLRSFNPFSSSLRLNKVYLDNLYLEIVKAKEVFSLKPIYKSSLLQEKPAKEEARQELGADKKGTSKTKKKKEDSKSINIEIKDFYLQNSAIRYIDKSRKPEIDLTFIDLNLEIHNFHYPQFMKFIIDLKSSVKVEDEILKDLITIVGWVDYFNKKMDVTLKVDSFQYSAFSQFYPSIWQHQNLGLEKAILSLNSEITAEDNNLVIDNLLSLEEIEFTEINETNEKELSRQRLIKTVIGLLKDKNGKSQIRLKLKTKMDAPKINLSLLGKGLQESVPLGPKFITEQIIYKAGDIVKEGINKSQDVPQNTIETTIDAIKDTVDKFKDMFEN
ncbi:MAG: DUF748 domain-containing protein [Candidatus Omnitrophica bacterium]|nr:DUF748 domain-containing protein [Candidatus Omnitrophota bacterium]